MPKNSFSFIVFITPAGLGDKIYIIKLLTNLNSNLVVLAIADITIFSIIISSSKLSISFIVTRFKQSCEILTQSINRKMFKTDLLEIT